MPPLLRSNYKVTGSIGKNKIVALLTFDRKNNSIHLHFHGEMFGDKKTKIQVKHADIKFPEGKDADVIRQVLAEYSPSPGLEVMRITKVKVEKKSAEGNPIRVIVRFRSR